MWSLLMYGTLYQWLIRTDLGNKQALHRWQVIIQINDDNIHWHIHICMHHWTMNKPLNNWVIFFQNIILFSCVVHYKYNISVWNWSNTKIISSALWVLMVWCFSTRASVATLLNTHPCVSSCLGVNTLRLRLMTSILRTTFLNCYQKSLKFLPKDLIDN